MTRSRPRARPRNLLTSGLFPVLAVLLGWSAPSPATAQTILNTERFQLAEVDGFHASADLSFSLQRGNKDLLDVSTSGMVGTLSGRHWPRVIFGGKYLSTDDRAFLDQQFMQLRYSYILSPATQTFHFVQMQKNETLLLRSRWLLGTGVRRVLFESEGTTLALGTGVMREWERLEPGRVGPEDDPAQDALRMANLGVFSHEFGGGARILNIVYVQPDVRELSNVRVLNDLGLLIPLSARLRTTMSLEWRRDTRPPSTLERDDLTLRAGFALEFN
jgi:hypothetical protein